MARGHSRRKFLRLTAGGCGGSLVGCTEYSSQYGKPTATPTTAGVSVRWWHDIGDEVPGAVIEDDIVYTMSDPSENGVGGVYAFELATGEEQWRYSRLVAHVPPPIIAEGTVYAVNQHSLVALDAETGTEQWRQTWEGLVTTAPAVGDDNIYIGNSSPRTSHSEPAYPEDLFALKKETGEVVWKRQLKANDHNSEVAGWRPPVFLEERDILILATTTGGAVVLDVQDGSRIDTLPHEQIRDNHVGMFQETGLVFGVFNEKLYAYNPASREVEWQAEGVSITPDGGGGRIAAGTREQLHAFDAQTGTHQWSKTIEGDTLLWNAYTATETGIYANSIDDQHTTLTKYNPDGEIQWELGLQTDDFSRVVEQDGIAVVGTGSLFTPDDGADGSILALESTE